MQGEKRTISEINEKLKRGEAIILTAQEIKKGVRQGKSYTFKDVDIVTTATRGVMSGTAAMLLVPVAERGVFSRAKKIWLNGVPGFPGPAPNERLGSVDTLVYGTAHSRYDPARYSGGHLFRDIVAGKRIMVECESEEGKTFESSFAIHDLQFARLYSFRNAFENYVAFSNLKDADSYLEDPRTIFSFRPLVKGRGLTVSGTGEINPIRNDHALRTIKVGTRVLVNKAPGVIVGCGTRSSPAKPNLSLAADMFEMDPEYMGGFNTSFGPEVITSVAVPIPVLDEEILEGITSCLNEQISLPVADISDRIPVTQINYADIWTGADLEVDFDESKCIRCGLSCPAEYYCPMGAISWARKEIEQTLCFSCGACTVNCLGGAFRGKPRGCKGHMGTVQVLGESLPIIFRQSDLRRSLRLAEYLQDLLYGGGFLLTDSQLDLAHR